MSAEDGGPDDCPGDHVVVEVYLNNSRGGCGHVYNIMTVLPARLLEPGTEGGEREVGVGFCQFATMSLFVCMSLCPYVLSLRCQQTLVRHIHITMRVYAAADSAHTGLRTKAASICN